MSNIEKLAAYLNQQDQPEKFARLLLTICKPGAECLANGQEEPEVRV